MVEGVFKAACMGVLFCGLSGMGVRLRVPPLRESDASTGSLAHTIYGVSNAFKTLPVVYRPISSPKMKQPVGGSARHPERLPAHPACTLEFARHITL